MKPQPNAGMYATTARSNSATAGASRAPGAGTNSSFTGIRCPRAGTTSIVCGFGRTSFRPRPHEVRYEVAHFLGRKVVEQPFRHHRDVGLGARFDVVLCHDDALILRPHG